MNDNKSVVQILSELEAEKLNLTLKLEGALTDKQRIDREVNSLHEKISEIYETIASIKRKFNEKPNSSQIFSLRPN